MNETKQSTQEQENAITRNAFWATIALAAITFLVSGYFFTVLFRESRTLVVYVAMAVFLSGMTMMVTSIMFTIRGRQETGVKLAFYMLFVLGVAAVGLFQGRVFTVAPSVLVISIITVNWLIPRQLRPKYAALIVVGTLLMGAIEWVDPPWRIEVAAANAGPIGAVIFTIVLIVLAFSQYRNYSLRTKLLAGFLLVAIVPLGILFFIQQRGSRQNLTEQANIALQGSAAQTVEALDHFILDGLNDVRTAAQLHIFEEYLSLPASERANSETEAVVYEDLLSIARRDQIYISSVGLLDLKGKNLADTTTSEIGEDNSDQLYFKEALKTNLPYVSPVVIDEGVSTLFFTAPVRTHQGKIIGVLRIRYNAASLQAILVDAAGTAGVRDGVVDLLDENHILLGISDAPDEILHTLTVLPAEKLAQLQAENRLPEGPAESLSINNTDLAVGLNNFGQQPIFPIESEGEQAAAASMQHQPWVVVFAQPQQDYLAPLAEQTRIATIVILLIVGLVAVFGFVVAQSFSNPVVRLTDVAQQISAGDLSAQAKVESKDEIGTLAGTFNIMTSQLRELITTLEQRVADRTKDLEAAQVQMARRAVELQIVAEIATKASQATNENDMLQTVVDLTKESFDLYHAHIYLFDETKSKLVLAAGAGEVGSRMVNEKRSIITNHPRSLVARAARTAQGAISNDVSKEPDFLPNPLLPDTRSEMAIPIVSGDTVFGVLDVQGNIVDRFTDEDVAIKTTLAQQVAASLANLRQYQISQKMARELGVVANVSTSTATITEASRLLQEVVDKTKEAFSLYHAHIYLLNETGDILELAAGAGNIGKQMVSEGRQIPLNSEKSLVARAARTRVGAVVNDVSADPDFLPHPLLPQTKSEQAVPMIVGDKVLGVLDVQSEQLNRFTEIDVNITTTLASQVAVALQNARTFSQAQHQAQRESMLNTIGQKIQSATSVEAVLQIAARELGRALSAPMTIAQLGKGAKEHDNGSGDAN